MLGERIGALRRQAGLSQSQMADRLRISASAVGMYEQGRREPSADTLLAMAQLFGVSVDYLLTGEEDPARRAALDRMLLSRIGRPDRPPRPFSREELAVLFAAMLME